MLATRISGMTSSPGSASVALEPSGTYGDPFRQALTDAGLNVQRVSPKAAHDYAEVFDGVPSQHDGKESPLKVNLGTPSNQHQEGLYGFRLVPVSGAGLSDASSFSGG